MYAFIVLVMLNGSPQTFVMERGLTAEACEALRVNPDSGLLIDGRPISGERRCVLESSLPPVEDDESEDTRAL